MTDFRVVSAAEVADEIVKRLAANQLPAHFGDWVKEQAQFGERWGQIVLGYGNTPAVMHYKLKPSGAIDLMLSDLNGQNVWETTLRPVA